MMADKYEVAALLRLCEHYLADQADLVEVVLHLLLAHEHHRTRPAKVMYAG